MSNTFALKDYFFQAKKIFSPFSSVYTKRGIRSKSRSMYTFAPLFSFLFLLSLLGPVVRPRNAYYAAKKNNRTNILYRDDRKMSVEKVVDSIKTNKFAIIPI